MKWEQRELEFKAYYHKSTWQYKFESGTGEYYCNDEWENWPPVIANGEKGIFVVQYSGVKDVNGKKIFEGDLVEVRPNEAENVLIRLVKYNPNTGFNLPLYEKCIDTMCGTGTTVYFAYEIIGNIFQNPEIVE